MSEATMILLDNSEYSRNGDYPPNRWESQYDAATIVANRKFQSNPETTVGLITMAGRQVEILLTPTMKPEKVHANLYGIKINGEIHLKNAIQIAQLALKHRINKIQRQRICIFIASPVKEDEKTLNDLAFQLKRNSIAVDIVNIGEMDEEQVSKLRKFIEKVNKSDNSSFLNVQPGIAQLSDQLLGTPILGGSQNQAIENLGGLGGGMNQNNGGVNPDEDPELWNVIQESLKEAQLEEERKNQKMEEEKNVNNNNQQNQNQAAQNEQKKKENEEEEEYKKIGEQLDKGVNIKDKSDQQNNDENVADDPEFLNSLLDNLGDDIDKNDPEIKKLLEKKDKKGDNNDGKN